MKDLKIAVCQLITTDNKQSNIKKAVQMIDEAAKNGAELIVLPEMFNCPYDNSYFPKFAEVFPGETSLAMINAAKKNNVYLVAGSIPEEKNGKIFNTSYFYNRSGDLIGTHRKMHLFDIDVKNKIYFKESDTLTAGNDITIVNTEFGKIGLAICYDIRFVELFRIMSLKGAELVILPAAFNMTTGPAHWELSIRMRALDNQFYVIGAAPARNINASYLAYGNSRVSNPWGEIIASCDEKEQIIYSDLKGDKITSVREQLPLLKHRRTDLYSINFLKK